METTDKLFPWYVWSILPNSINYSSLTSGISCMTTKMHTCMRNCFMYGWDTHKSRCEGGLHHCCVGSHWQRNNPSAYMRVDNRSESVTDFTVSSFSTCTGSQWVLPTLWEAWGTQTLHVSGTTETHSSSERNFFRNPTFNNRARGIDFMTPPPNVVTKSWFREEGEGSVSYEFGSCGHLLFSQWTLCTGKVVCIDDRSATFMVISIWNWLMPMVLQQLDLDLELQCYFRKNNDLLTWFYLVSSQVACLRSSLKVNPNAP